MATVPNSVPNDGLKSVRDTYLYSILNKGGSFDTRIKTFLSKGVTVTQQMLETQFTMINNYFKFILKVPVMRAVEEGYVKPMIFPEGIGADKKIPTNLPFILTKEPSGVVVAVAVLDNHARIDHDNKDRLSIDANKLYCLLEGAFIARGLQLGFNKVRHNTTMYSEGASIYAHMFTRVLNKQYALNVDKGAYNKVLFLSAKFFMINILQMKDSDMIFNYACKIAGNISPIVIKQLNDMFRPEYFKDISTFISGLAENGYMIINGMQSVNTRDYIKKYIHMYSNAALFSLEHLAYFVFNIVSCINHAYLNNQEQFVDAIGTKSGDKLYAHIATCVADR